ncbi:unnamed protein product [Didymodactylos carnosus]|uniref:ubiquitinyl hydrolase 1 n=1 Tax=Didymodactylos carnosus TaxID=1234261 RepID=A0A814Y3A8_9BILA|nr:unnamed protein product [Didymodactylos carnosus]CAF1223889.1 unnamed protein product [Didymodactylos carnosus]CAF3803536.1 unnamed protein product [Didymodactylos carnosus]CAF3987068.1 unnamed protein product [Didymodactylos carnosus]
MSTNKVQRRPIVICFTCQKDNEKGTGIIVCGGCRETFCTRHFTQHRDKIIVDFNCIIAQHSQIQQDFNTQIAVDPLEKINQLEAETMAKIKLVFNKARERLSELTDKKIEEQIKEEFRSLTNELHEKNTTSDYVEPDIEEWNKQLDEMRVNIEYFRTKAVYVTSNPIDYSKIVTITKEKQKVQISEVKDTINENIQHNLVLVGADNGDFSCFNSALECLYSVDEFTAYILNLKPSDIEGQVANAYARLVKQMRTRQCHWQTEELIRILNQYQHKFHNESNRDSFVILSFLLDGLHAGLNLVTQETNEKKKDDDGSKNDSDLAKEQWEYYKKWNQSKISDLFHGQLKSQIQCLDCETTRRTFDPISFLHLPIPDKKNLRVFKVEYVRQNGKIKCYNVKTHKQGRMLSLIENFVQKFSRKKLAATTITADELKVTPDNDDENLNDNDFLDENDDHIPKVDHILPTEVYNHCVHLQYSNDSLLSNILEHDQIVFYEVPVSLNKENNETILMPCFLRAGDIWHQNFGLPFYLNIPRHICHGKNIVDALQQTIKNYLPLNTSSVNGTTKPLYVAHCVFKQNNVETTKLLNDVLDHLFDFTRVNTTLFCDVAQHIVNQYKKDEQKRLDNRVSTISFGTNRIQQEKQSMISLLDCFTHFTVKEKLSDLDQWYCPQCKSLKKAVKTSDLWLLPKVLNIQLKRFNYNHFYFNKIDLFVDCPKRDLDLSQFVSNHGEKQNAKYDLIAVSNNMDLSGSGHYTTHVKKSLDQKWYRFDDSGTVSYIDEQDVVTKSAYVLVYQQQSNAHNRCVMAKNDLENY